MTEQGPTQRELDAMRRLNDESERRHQAFAAWLESRDHDAKRRIAATQIYDLCVNAMSATLCNYDAVIDCKGGREPILQLIARLERAAEADFKRLTGIEHITGTANGRHND